MSNGECQPENQGQCQPKTHPARATIGRCNSKRNDNVITIDGSKIDVVIIDAPETSNQGSRHLDASSNLKKMCSSNNIISIDDEGDDENDGFIGTYQNATSSKTFHPSSTTESDDECQLLSGQEEAYSKSPKGMFDVHSSECSTSESDMFESEMSESDIFVTTDSDGDSDCEIMDDSTVNFREEWEKAALKKKMERSHTLTKEGTCAFQSHHEPGISMSETGQKKDGFPSTNNGTQTGANSETEKAHPDAIMSAIGKGDPPLDGFTEESWLNCRKKHSAHDLDHAVEDMHQRQSSQKNNESLSKNLHRAQQRFEPFDHELNSDCGLDAQAPKSFPCNSQMQRDPHSQSEKAFPMHKEGVNKGAALFTDGMLDMQQDEDVLRHGSSYSCTNDCPSGPSQHMPDSKSRKVEYASEGVSSFHPQHERASFEQDACPGETHTDLYAVCSFGGEEEAVSGGSLQNLAQEDIEQSTLQNVSMTSDVQKYINGEWETHKNIKENRLADEEECASKRQQLQIQTEAMQRLQKRKKAETLRLLEMEKRQKQRLDEMRESQKQEEESINLKDQFRAEIRKKLEKLEMKYRDMASLLRGLGVNVGSGLYPLPHEVNVAYRQALLRFHPDRASRTDIRQQVESEEKFKLISRLKEKLLPVAYY